VCLCLHPDYSRLPIRLLSEEHFIAYSLSQAQHRSSRLPNTPLRNASTSSSSSIRISLPSALYYPSYCGSNSHATVDICAPFRCSLAISFVKHHHPFVLFTASPRSACIMETVMADLTLSMRRMFQWTPVSDLIRRYQWKLRGICCM
jgi:hypothetical protein